MSNFNEVIKKLSDFWTNYTTLIPGLNSTVGAGTYHPKCFFGSLQKDPLNICFVQPSQRDNDGRYGESPNRLLIHHQFQVFLKPAPDNIRELFLESLESLGIEKRKNSIRFIDNNWESATLYAQGIGWECWVNQMEVCQFTYFQKMGGLDLNEISVELAYGIERNAIFASGKESIWDVSMDNKMTYKDMFFEREKQLTDYCLNLREPLECIEEKEIIANNLLQSFNYLGAYEVFLEMQQNFNALDARKLLNEQKRRKFTIILQNLAKRIALAYKEKTFN